MGADVWTNFEVDGIQYVFQMGCVLRPMFEVLPDVLPDVSSDAVRWPVPRPSACLDCDDDSTGFCPQHRVVVVDP